MPPRARRRPSRKAPVAFQIVPASGETDLSLLELVDHLLNQGVVLSGDVVLGLADVDLVYLRLCALVCAADRVLPAAGPRVRGRARN